MRQITTFLVSLTVLTGCLEPEGGSGGTVVSGDWSIPINQVFDGGPGRDGIPAIDNPELIAAAEATFLTSSELVIGYYDGETAIAYPHQILDWHEIINDQVNGLSFAVTYCPLTGTGIGWNRMVDGSETSFGVSGLLYNTNLIPFDRNTNSNWSQMLLSSVNGQLMGTEIGYVPLVETRWDTWKQMYPETLVISRNTGHRRSYGSYPYGDYRTNDNNLLFPISNDDGRLDRKERVHGIIVNGKAKVYRFDQFDQLTVITDRFNGRDLIVAGDKDRNFIVSFYVPQAASNTTFQFEAVDEGEVILVDNEGNRWNIFGQAVSGPRQGEQLINTVSCMGYWFAWGTFYPDPEISEF